MTQLGRRACGAQVRRRRASVSAADDGGARRGRRTAGAADRRRPVADVVAAGRGRARLAGAGAGGRGRHGDRRLPTSLSAARGVARQVQGEGDQSPTALHRQGMCSFCRRAPAVTSSAGLLVSPALVLCLCKGLFTAHELN